MKTYGTIRCHDCTQILDDKVQYYDNGKVYCEVCNYRKYGKEYPPRKLSPHPTSQKKYGWYTK